MFALGFFIILMFPRGHHNLYNEARILHRDISVGNLMYDLRDGILYGIVNDYDNAVILDQDGNPQAPPSTHRTGTIPFMALDLLAPEPPARHLYRHDLESFFYVLVWTAVFFPREGRNSASAAKLDRWCNGNAKQRFDAKYTDVMDPRMIERLKFTDSFRALVDVAGDLHGLVCFGHTALIRSQLPKAMLERLGDKAIDSATLGGNITFKQFDEALTMALGKALRVVNSTGRGETGET